MQKKISVYFPPPKGTCYISYHFLSDVHIRSIWWLSNEKKKSTWYMFWTDPISIRYLENAALKLVKKWTVVIVVFGSHRLMQEPGRNLSDDSELLDIVNNCHQELRPKNWQHIRIRLWQGIKYSFRSKAKVYHTLRNLIEGEGQRKYLLPQICQGPPRGVDLGRWLYVLHAFCKKRNRAQPLNACIW